MNSERDLLSRIGQFLEYQQEVFGPIAVEKAAEPVAVSNRSESLPSLPDRERGPVETEVLEHPADATTLEALRELCARSPVLHTDLPEARLVFGVGRPDARLMLIGEAPGETEDRLGEPFVGEAGQLLTKMIEAIRLRRQDVYIANVGKRRPVNNRTPSPEECAAWYPFLKRQIELVNPRLILALGGVAAHTLLHNNDSVGSLRGRFHRWENTETEILVTYHPSALLRDPAKKYPAWDDLKLLRRYFDELGLDGSME